MASYRWGGLHYALPLDVACQVVARRPDRIPAPPQSWDEVAALAARGGVALSLAGPHAVLTLMSLAGSAGATPRGPDFLPDAGALPALDLMHRLFALRPEGSERLNPIGLLEAMAHGDEIALVPLVFGYVPYARPSAGRHALAYSDAPRTAGGFGGVLGGTGLAFSRRARVTAELRAHMAWLLSEAAQTGFIPRHNGQPGLRVAWHDATVNAAWGGFYRDTAASAEHALLRPRFDGYIAFQTAASAAIRAALEAREPPARTLATLRGLWRDARARARGPNDDDRGTA
jgi:multiple sugar transport system substrate-binding protein